MHAPVLVTPPSGSDPVVTTNEAKLHLRVDGTAEDTLIASLVSAAVAHLDGWSGILGRCLVQQTWRQDYDGFGAQCLRLPLPAVSITSIVSVDAAGDPATVAGANYALKADELGSYVRFIDDFSAPTDLAESAAVSVTFVAGYGAASAVPAAIKAAILLLVGHWYANREVVVTGTIAAQLPMAVDALLAPYRRLGI